MQKLTMGRRGLSAVGMVVAIVLVSTTLIAGIWVSSSMQSSVSQAGWTTAANNSYTQVVNNTWASYNLGSISVIVIAAVAIIGILVAGFAGAGRGAA